MSSENRVNKEISSQKSFAKMNVDYNSSSMWHMIL